MVLEVVLLDVKTHETSWNAFSMFGKRRTRPNVQNGQQICTFAVFRHSNLNSGTPQSPELVSRAGEVPHQPSESLT